MIRIIGSTQKISYMDEEGNISYIDGTNKVCLIEDQKVMKKLSKDYYLMDPIYDYGLEEIYIVCDAVCCQHLKYESDYDTSKLSFKYGIIAIQRDEKGNIIPMGEKIVVPILYDKIYENELKTVTAYVNDHLTYIDIDPNSENYGKQLVPAILEHAYSFSADYDGFTKCSVNGFVGYLPRNCKPRKTLEPSDLLTKEQVEYLLSYFELTNNDQHDSSVNKFCELTGCAKTLKLTRK